MKFGFRLFGNPCGDAKKIMGQDNVLLPKECKLATGTRKNPDCSVCYSPEEFEWCAEQNEKGEAWKFFCRTEQSLVGLRAKQPTEFCPASIWQDPLPFMARQIEPAGRLINFKLAPLPFFQLDLATCQVDRSWIITLAQALVGFNLMRDQRFLEKQFHWGEEDTFSDQVPLLGGYSTEGMLLYSLCAEYKTLLSDSEDIGTILCRVPRTVPILKKKE